MPKHIELTKKRQDIYTKYFLNKNITNITNISNITNIIKITNITNIINIKDIINIIDIITIINMTEGAVAWRHSSRSSNTKFLV